jgi:hypothetical protein
MLTTISVLVIVLGVMVSLARWVRVQSAKQVTKDVLIKLERLMEQYKSRNSGLLPVAPLMAGDLPAPPDERTLRRAAMVNNTQFVALLSSEAELARQLNALPVRLYDKTNVLDDWGNPIVYMSSNNKYIGMALHDQYFFFSAGPDGKYLTRADNLYSYEVSGGRE